MEPWLDSLSEDWKSDHHSSSPAPSISSQQKRSSIGSSKSQSRIPHLAQNIRKESPSGFLRPRSTRGLARSRNEPVLTERSASSLNVPPPNSGSQKRLSVSTLPRRTSAAFSDSVNSVQHHTVHERLNDTDTPDWKRRLANGEDVASDGFDLFAPSKLEGIFKEPTVRSERDNENSLIDSWAKPWKALDLSSAPSLNEQYQSLRASRSRAPVLTVLEEVDEDALDRQNFSAISSDIVRDGSIRGIVQKRVQSLERVQQSASSESTPAQSRPSSAGLDSTNDPRWRTVSGRKELEDEFISPVTASRQNTIRENAVKDSAVIDLETLDEKLAQIGVSHHQRPSSSSSDRQVSYQHSGVTAQDEEQHLEIHDITSRSLPDDLSMGTQDFMSHGGFVNRRRGGPSNEASFLKRGLSSADHSHLGSKLRQTFRSSPPPYSSSKDVSVIDRPNSPHPPSTPQEESVVRHDTPGRPAPSGSPLKLFGNRDTYTNNKLMRILSYFDESEHSNESKLDDAPPTPEQYELRMSRFGEGEFNKYDFDFEKQVSPVVAHLVQDAPSKIFVKKVDATLDESSKQPVVPPSPLRSPKRRRTLLKGEIAVDDQHLEVKVAHVEDSNMLAGTKRKDARAGDAGSQAEPDVLASRALLNPRSSRRSTIPVPSRHSVASATANHTDDQGQDMTQALAAELASFAHEAAEMHNDSRKPSLATKDYMEEANKVMEFIRARGKPKSALPDVEEPVEFSELDADKILDMDLDDESTKDQFSRPPSREGILRQPADRRHAVHDQKTASYLRKYQEDDDLEHLANNSGLGTLRVADNKAAEEASHVPVPDDSDQEEQESSPPNVRILNADQSQRKRKHSGSTLDEQNIASLPNNIATHNSDSSTRRTFPTSSSSGNRGMITHGTVSIPDQVGTMAFDHQRKIWVQATASLRRSQVQNNKERHSNTEDDPFANIPDLSFEELPTAKSKQASHQVHPEEELVQRDTAPGSREALPGSPTKPATKASIRTRDMNTDQQIHQQHEQHGYTDSSLRSEISQHEARLHDGIASKVPSAVPESKRQVRAVTIAFSSPLVSAVKYPEEPYLSDNDLLDEDVNLPFDDSEESLLQCSQRDARSLPPTPQQTPSKEEDRRYQNYRAMTLNRRPVSRIDEKEEDEPHVEMSLVHVNHSQKLIRTPLERSIVKAKAGKGHNTSILCLTPLSEFSLHQIDLLKHPEESFVEERANPKALRQANGSQALSVDALVKAITDASAGEIYWDKLRTLKLDDKRLTSLQSLNDYCFGLEELSVINNNVQHLNGLPASLRVLDIQQNALTNLASWGALRNLQYLDVSGNQLESLDGFSCLVHLRKLIANDNQIKNIDGVMELNGLLELEVHGNSLIDVDFEGSEMLRLKKLDLGSNKLRSVRNLHELTSLEELTVASNQLSMFGEKNDARSSLQVLNAAHNLLETFDLAKYPDLRLLDLDGNKLKTVEGLQSAYKLESLSLRGQRAISEVVSNILSTPSECRSIYLSSNLVPGGCFELPLLPHHNLREVELSGCGISELPPGFGQLFPNCRKLKLAFNGISDIGNLRGMQKLVVLCVARNRVNRLRRTCLVLSRLETLRTLDVRDNPVSLGFYPPQHNTSSHDASGPEMYYQLLKRSVEKDQAWWRLLDETTKLKRRMIELLLAEKCPNLQELDGATFVREPEVKMDQTWDILTQKGVLVKPEPGVVQELDTNGVRGTDSSLHDGIDVEGYDEERSVMVE